MRAARGMTLIELLVGLAVASVLTLLVAVISANLMQMGVGSSRTRESEAKVGLGLSVLDRALANSGAGFGDSRYAFRIYNNLAAGSTALKVAGGGNLDVVVKGSANPGVIAGTDVFEVSYDDASVRRPGVVLNPPTCAASVCTVKLATGDPFLDTELTAIEGAAGVETGPLLLFTNELGRACVGRPRNSSGLAPQLEVVMKTDDGATAPVAPVVVRWQAANANCPQQGDTVYALGRRRRFVVWQDANGQNMGLAAQDADVVTAGPNPGSSGIFANTPPTMLALGVENLQVAPSLPNPGLAPGPLGCGQAMCRCDDGTGTCALSNADHPPNGTDRRSNVRMVSIELTQRGGYQRGAAQPASYDSPAGAVDNFTRSRGETSVTLNNLFLVNQ